ncbi:MAG: hypothetical protein ACOX0U_09965 [Oscillospiraceae bacterium]|jgi:hypothetical protein
MKPASAHFFLGANTPNGFYSIYDQLMTKDFERRLIILKGGPGCGKSSFMRHVANALDEPTEYIHCSGDPDSLDAVIFPRLHTAIADGTAPHVIEPRYPGVLDAYINLGTCYDRDVLSPLTHEICSATDRCGAQYQRAYRILSAAQHMADPIPLSALSSSAVSRMKKRVRAIAARELKKKPDAAAPGAVIKRLLGGLTYQGLVCRFDTVDALCSRVYTCIDPYGLAHASLRFFQETALDAGYDVISCPAPMEPEHIEHVLVPELSLAFITSTDSMPYEGKPIRKLRFDQLLESEWVKSNRTRLRFHKKMTRMLTADAVAAFAEAKQIHDELEKLYNPAVSFEAVYQTADQLAEQLKQK